MHRAESGPILKARPSHEDQHVTQCSARVVTCFLVGARYADSAARETRRDTGDSEPAGLAALTERVGRTVPPDVVGAHRACASPLAGRIAPIHGSHAGAASIAGLAPRAKREPACEHADAVKHGEHGEHRKHWEPRDRCKRHQRPCQLRYSGDARRAGQSRVVWPPCGADAARVHRHRHAVLSGGSRPPRRTGHVHECLHERLPEGVRQRKFQRAFRAYH